MNGKNTLWGDVVGGVLALCLMSYLFFGIPVLVDLSDGKVDHYPGTLYEPVVRIFVESDTATQEECEDDCDVAYVTTEE